MIDALYGLDLAARARVVASGASGELPVLARGLADELAPWLNGAPLPWAGKARLTVRGGRCAHDGVPLRFDPHDGTRHVCPRCASVFTGREHDDWWATGAHLFIAERAVHAALLGALGVVDVDRSAAFVSEVLGGIAARYASWPLRDNVLGPTRPFFSTYLESVWLLNVVSAASIARTANAAHAPLVDRLITGVVEPSRRLVASFPEGVGNRGAWRTAALLAAARLVGDEAATRDALEGPGGLRDLLTHGLHDDGTWWEGENYHLFAHRGLAYAMRLANAAGWQSPPMLHARFLRGFTAPFRTVLPDGTWPARRDSRYRSPVAQWRTAEWLELGWAWSGDDAIAAQLAAIYGAPLPEGTSWRAASTADIEQDEPPVAITRAALGWRALAFASASAPPAVSLHPASALLPAQGVVVLRRDAGRIHVAMETGATIGGHGHPDTLGVVVQDGARRVQEDPGTGSYVDPSLHWYRSTLAHGAPLVDGRSQSRAVARCTAFDARGGAAWTRAEATIDGVTFTRTLVLLDTHVVDTLVWSAARDVTVDLPWHVDGDVSDARTGATLAWEPADIAGGDGLEDGFSHLTHVERATAVPSEGIRIGTDVTVHAGAGSALWRAVAPGPPATSSRAFTVIRQHGRAGRITGVWSLRGDVLDVSLAKPAPAADAMRELTSNGLYGIVDANATIVRVTLAGGTVAEHAPTSYGWQIALRAGPARSSIDLLVDPDDVLAGDPGSSAEAATASRADDADRIGEGDDLHAGTDSPIPDVPSPSAPLRFTDTWPVERALGALHYRRGDVSWEDAGRPEAYLAASLEADGLVVHVDVAGSPPDVVPLGAPRILDNELPAVHGAGVQVYVGPAAVPVWSAAWLVLPATAGARPATAPSRALLGPDVPIPAECLATDDGWRLTAIVPRALLPHDAEHGLRFDVCINERPAGWERRRGQFVLSGARGGWVYLRGDRHDAREALLVRSAPAAASIA